MQKETFLEIGKEVAGFKIVDPKKAPKGLTKQLLWNLWDIGVKFGSFFEKGIGFKASPLEMELYDFRGNGAGGTAGLTVTESRPSHLMDKGVSLFELKNGINVVWDNGLVIKNVLALIKEIDDYALSEGIKVEGDRVLINKNPQSKKMPVQIFLDSPSTTMLIPRGMDIEQALKDFDCPDFLDIIHFGLIRLICLKTEKDKLIKEQKFKIKRLEEMEITAENIENMSADEIIELKKT